MSGQSAISETRTIRHKALGNAGEYVYLYGNIEEGSRVVLGLRIAAVAVTATALKKN
jgi:hypothetical protein